LECARDRDAPQACVIEADDVELEHKVLPFHRFQFFDCIIIKWADAARDSPHG
jgi:hypothetical protein